MASPASSSITYHRFNTAVQSIAAFDELLIATESTLEAKLAAAIDERFNSAEVQDHINSNADSRYDAKAHELSEAALEALGEHNDSDEIGPILKDPRVMRFIEKLKPPSGVLKKTAQLRGFIGSKVKALARDALFAHEAMKARKAAAEWVQEHSTAVADAKTEAAAARRRAIEKHCGALAQSDHLPIRATIHWSTLSSSISVASMNTQEHVRDGLGTYMSRLPHLQKGANSRKGRVVRLVDAGCDPLVIARQCKDVVAFITDELQTRGTLAVCLQEVGRDLLAALRSANLQWHVHASSNGARAQDGDDGRCEAMTCIVSSTAFSPEADVVVETKSASNAIKRRAFAAVTFASHGLTLVSVHVRHADGSSGFAKADKEQQVQQPSNAERIRDAEGAIRAAFPARRILCIGDFNGPPLEEPQDGVRRASPQEPTQYGAPHAVDCVVLMSDEEATIACSVVEPPADVT